MSDYRHKEKKMYLKKIAKINQVMPNFIKEQPQKQSRREMKYPN